MRVAMLSKALVHTAYHSKLEELAKLGVDIHAIVPHRFAGECLAEISAAPFSIVKKHLYLAGSHHISFYLGLAKALRTIDPDVFHIDEEPFNLVTHQALAATPTSHTVVFTWQNLERAYPFPFSYFRKGTLRRCQAAIAGSKTAAQVLRRAGFQKTIEIIPQFGVDPQVYRKAPQRDDTVLTVGFLGRLVPEKGVDLLLTAVRALPLRVLICGDGPLRRRLRQQAERDSVRLMLRPRIPSEEVPGVINSMDVLVLPSRSTARWAEQFGRVLVEAMACEVPVIGSSSGEISNVIGDAGLLFREGDAEDLRARIVELTTHRDLRLALGEKGRQRVLKHFTQQRIAEKTFRLYQSMLRRS